MVKYWDYRKLALGVIALAVFVGLHCCGVSKLFSFEAFQQSKIALTACVQNHYWFTVFAYMTIFTSFVVFAIPSPTVLTIIGGFLFGIFPALLIVLLSSTIGAIGAFLFAQYIAGDMLQERYKERLQNFNENFNKHGKWYLLSVRLIPFFPFSLISFLAGLTNVDLFTFAWTTAAGILPGTVLLVYGGNHLEYINSVSDFFSPEIIIGLLLLSFLGLMPFFLKK